MGRMINIFDLSAGMAETKKLTEKAHRDGSPIPRGRPDVIKKITDPVDGQIEDKPVTHEKRSFPNKKSSGTPMKMLIAQEMSKEMESWQKPPTVIARLMGLDGLPAQQSASIGQRPIPECNMHSSYTTSGAVLDCQQQQGNVYPEGMVPCVNKPLNTHACEHRVYKDVYEVWQQPSRNHCFKDEPCSRGRCNENPNEKRMDLVRQKFMEAKRLATNQKLLHSKEFQDALEVLSSNRDIFLKFLEEPNSLFSKHFNEPQTAPTPAQTKRITVLKPSKTLDKKAEIQPKKHLTMAETNGCDKNKPSLSSGFIHPKAESLSQTTRIVVLKPSPGKLKDAKAVVASHGFSPILPEPENLFKELSTDGGKGSREVAKEIAQQMRESISNRRDEALLSSVLSNGYIGDESSFNRSGDEYMEDGCANFSDSEVITPISQHSWNYNNRFDSPCTQSPCSRTSYSPESSVIREAKKRLSERWVMVTTNGMNQEQREVRRSASTLGEMLSLPETKQIDGRDGAPATLSSRSYADHDLKLVRSSLSINENEDENEGKNPPQSLQRSQSVPVSSSVYENVQLDTEASGPLVVKSTAAKGATKLKTGKSSFKGLVSSFFFSRSKKNGQEKSSATPLADFHGKVQSSSAEFCGKSAEESHCATDYCSSDGPCHNYEKLLAANLSLKLDPDGQNGETTSAKVALSFEKPQASENASASLEQPSPISVLEAPFKEVTNNISSQYSDGVNIDCHRAISRSPPIESIARSLSWDVGTHSERKSSDPSKHSTNFLKANAEEQERNLFVRTLLSFAGLNTETSSTVIARWHSLESPLNPALLDKFLEQKEDARCRERRSNQRLLFDCVNAALLEISWNGVLSMERLRICKGEPTTNSVMDSVLGRLNEWLSDDGWRASSYGDNNSLMVDCVVRKEVGGKWWSEMMGSEIAEIGMVIEGLVLEELVKETLDDFISGWLK